MPGSEAISQLRSLRSRPNDNNFLFAGSNDSPNTGSVWPTRASVSGRPDWASQTRTVPSVLPDATWRPSGLKPIAVTARACATQGAPIGFPVSASNNRTRPSKPPLATRRPSGLKVMETIPPRCARSTTRNGIDGLSVRPNDSVPSEVPITIKGAFSLAARTVTFPSGGRRSVRRYAPFAGATIRMPSWPQSSANIPSDRKT